MAIGSQWTYIALRYIFWINDSKKEKPTEHFSAVFSVIIKT